MHSQRFIEEQVRIHIPSKSYTHNTVLVTPRQIVSGISKLGVERTISTGRHSVKRCDIPAKQNIYLVIGQACQGLALKQCLVELERQGSRSAFNRHLTSVEIVLAPQHEAYQALHHNLHKCVSTLLVIGKQRSALKMDIMMVLP